MVPKQKPNRSIKGKCRIFLQREVAKVTRMQVAQKGAVTGATWEAMSEGFESGC